MEHIANFEKVLLKSGLDYQNNKVIDDYLLTGNPDFVREEYRSCQSDIADKMIELLQMKNDLTVLESGAGHGVILKKLVDFKNHYYCEINKNFIYDHLFKITDNFMDFDFFEVNEKFDRIIMNPPFSFRQYEKHILHGYELLNEKGIMVFLFPKAAFYREAIDERFKMLIGGIFGDRIHDVGKVCGECECIIGVIKK